MHGAKLEASNPVLLEELKAWKEKEGIAAHKFQIGRSPGHQRNFLDSVKSRDSGISTATNVEQAFLPAGCGNIPVATF